MTIRKAYFIHNKHEVEILQWVREGAVVHLVEPRKINKPITPIFAPLKDITIMWV